MEEYPKIETLFNRDPENKKHVLFGRENLRLPEFGLVDHWLVTEKINGTNIRVGYTRGSYTLALGGRTDNAQMSTSLLGYLNDTFTPEQFDHAFDYDVIEVTLFGEAYGPKIQSGGWYRDTPGFRLFDVKVGDWWLNWDNVCDVASKLGIKTVPIIGDRMTTAEAIRHVCYPSIVQHDDTISTLNLETRLHEGIVCRTDPLLFDRRGHRLMWKLKSRDLPETWDDSFVDDELQLHDVTLPWHAR